MPAANPAADAELRAKMAAYNAKTRGKSLVSQHTTAKEKRAAAEAAAKGSKGTAKVPTACASARITSSRSRGSRV